MASASLFIVPLPPAIPDSKNKSSLQQIFGPQASAIMPLFEKIASKEPDEDSYYQYLIALRACGNSPFPTKWSNPFKSSEIVPSQSVYGEALNVVWNFMVFLQNKVRTYNCIAAEDIDNIKECIRDMNTLTQNLKFLSENMQHPVYTTNLYRTVESYNKCINGILFLQLFQNSNPQPGSVIKVSQGIQAALRDVENNAKALSPVFSSYFAQFIPLMIKYFTGVTYLQAGMEQVARNEFGAAISYFRRGLGLVQSKSSVNCPFSYVTAQVKMIENSLNTSNQKYTVDNTKIYNKYIPDVPPELPQGIPCKTLENLRPLLLIFTSDSQSGGPGVAPQGQYPSVPPQGQYPSVPTDGDTSASSLSIPFSSIHGLPSFPPPAGGPPAFQPTNGGQPPQFQPTNGGQPSVPGSPPPFVPTSTAGYASPQSDPSATEFPAWKNLCEKKAQITNRMMLLRQNKPQTAQIIDQYYQQAQIAQQSDAVIQQTIVQFMTYGPTEVTTKEGINAMIGQADNFYQQLNQRLDQIEQQF